MPRSDFVRELISGDLVLPAGEFDKRMNAAVDYIVAVQEQAGVDVLTDGEWRRKSYIGVIAELAHGFQLSRNPADGRPWTIVVDKLSAKAPGFVAREVAYVRNITKRRIKATLPSPALLGERMWDPALSAKAYPNRRDFINDCAAILHEEFKLLRAAGAHIIQIDDPHLCLFVDDVYRKQYDDPDQAADFAAGVHNDVVGGVTGVQVAVHLCRRAGARARGEAGFSGGFERIIGQLNRLRVHHVTMEYAAPGSGDYAVLGRLREDLEVGLGCVDVTPGVIDSPDTIADRVRQAARHIAPERITLNPDCGFAPGSGAVVSIDEAYQKLRNEVRAAEMLRAEFA